MSSCPKCGATGVRDQGLLESALARPRQVYAYADDPSLTRLAAAYAFGFAGNHAFVDGNKRTAWVVCATFLELNGREVTADQAGVVSIMLGVAGSTVSEDRRIEWLQQNSAG
ncbi:MAG TPA: type II toxin-antitoxin system death-on-curing family toxin [Candidatus Solibacter sp.]|nr:type II toxin-antitoxin system death-on-curing family toxin [Candidatus Solibacter sp.]